MMSTKKPRSDSKLDNLQELQLLALRDGLLDRTFDSYQAALDWLDADCGVSSSAAALSGFWRNHCAPVVAARRQMAAIRAEALGDAMREDPVNWDEAIIEKTKQLAFEFLDSETADPDAIKKLLDAILKAKGQELDERKVVLLEGKARLFDKLKDTVEADDDLTPEERLKKIREGLKI